MDTVVLLPHLAPLSAPLNTCEAVHIANSAPAHGQLYFLQICKLTALFNYFKWEDGNAPWYTCTQCSWWCNPPRGATTKFKFTNIFLCSVWGQTTKFKDHPYFRLYGILPYTEYKCRCTLLDGLLSTQPRWSAPESKQPTGSGVHHVDTLSVHMVVHPVKST